MSRKKTLPQTINKLCPVCNKMFTTSYYLRNKRTYCNKSCANHDPRIIEKMIISQNKTFIKKYGMHPMKTEKTQENLKKTIQTKYGVNWISNSDGWYEKVKTNNLRKYGIENYNNINKIKQTCREKYGVSSPLQSKKLRLAIAKLKHNDHYDYLTKFCNDNDIAMLFTHTEYNGDHFSNQYKFKCKKCDYMFENSVHNLNSLYCIQCHPNKILILKNSFFEFLSSLTPSVIIKRNDQIVLYKKTLDFFLPEKKIAFELSDLRLQSDLKGGMGKNYHLNKMRGCLSHGIRLIRIFENEWRDNRFLVESVIKTILKCNNQDDVLYEHNCVIKNISVLDKNIFLNENHLRKEDKSTIKLGLYYENKLVSVMTFRKTSRFNDNVEWELSRFCNLKGFIVIDAASKLFSHFVKMYNPKSIVSYSDRRYFSGDLYNKLGFSFVNNTSPSYHYITPDYKNIINRMSFQKHLLHKRVLNFNPNVSEWENMKNNGYDRIWDCGNGKWIFKP